MRYQCGSSASLSASGAQNCEWWSDREMMMSARVTLAVLVPLALGAAGSVHAQDVPGIEICTVEKTMERRTSCLQSNVDFLQKTINKLTADHQQKLDAANRQVASLQK